MTATATTVDPAEVERFSALAAEWWDPKGKFAVLHRFNPVRLAYIREQVTARLARDPHDPAAPSRASTCSTSAAAAACCRNP